MRIVIDMQGTQTESRFRGIGRYAMSFAKAIAANRGKHEIILALNGLFPQTIGFIRNEFNKLLPQNNILVWHIPGPVRESENKNLIRNKCSKLIREAFIANLQPDVVIITSLFEGFVDDAVTSIGEFTQRLLTSVVLHDLIPLLNPETYLNNNPEFSEHYKQKIKYLRDANQWLTNSEHTANEGKLALNLQPENVINISTASDPIFTKMLIRENEKQQILKRFDIKNNFIFYTGGTDPRKNLHRLIRSYAKIPQKLRKTYQLVFAGKMDKDICTEFKKIASESGMQENEIVITGYISDVNLASLYNLCYLFVFPSWHEGFGLPALEAMSCGAPVIGSNTSSLPEVIGLEDALFDPYNETIITHKLIQAIENKSFHHKLSMHGLEQAKKFSWDNTAKKAIIALENLFEKSQKTINYITLSENRPKLAFVSPLPPEKTGIANYSAELIPELIKFYDIEVVVDQKQIDDEWIKNNCHVRDYKWLKNNANKFQRVLYHFGNSPFHTYMLDLLEEVPGVVVLHDFYLSSLFAYLEEIKNIKNIFSNALYQSHGYYAVHERFNKKNINYSFAKDKYPANLQVLQNAFGLIVHSGYSIKLISKWYGDNFIKNVDIIPLLRNADQTIKRDESRSKLGIPDYKFVVCSFGFLDSTKLNHKLLNAWLNSGLSKDPDNLLIFVGENHGGDYGKQLLETIRKSGLKNQIHITGWTDMPEFQNYLAASDIAVQLRTLSRGETSASALDCMVNGIATIINAHGSMSDFPEDAVWMLPDVFEEKDLTEALEALWKNNEKRAEIGKRAREIILTKHSPKVCTKNYAASIEKFYSKKPPDVFSLVKKISEIKNPIENDDECITIAYSIDQSIPLKNPKKQLLLDISATFRTDLKTGIERVTRSILMEFLKSPPEGFRVEPVYLSDEGGKWHYKYARTYTLTQLECPVEALNDDVVEMHNGDILLGLDLSGELLIKAAKSGLLSFFRDIGIKIYYIVYDLLPVRLPHFFPTGSDLSHGEWLKTITNFDGALCISKSVANVLKTWLEENIALLLRTFNIGYFKLGADIESSIPTKGLPDESEKIISILKKRTSFLMVGTIEPRKGHLQTLSAFNQLWNQELDINLIIVGKEGWKNLEETKRRTIPEIIKNLQNNPEKNNRLFWLEGISDEFLEKIYKYSDCLISASEGEGFGLPLIEAAMHNLPIISRDIPVFREVAGENAFFFKGYEPENLAKAIKNWLELYNKKMHPKSDNIKWFTWQESSQDLFNTIINNNWLYTIKIDPYIKPDSMQTHLSRRLKWKSGWSVPENEFIWSNGEKASLSFQVSEKDLGKLNGIYLMFDTLGKQRIEIYINNEILYNEILDGIKLEAMLSTYSFQPGNNIINFNLPDAKQPDNGDPRTLAIAIRKFMLISEIKNIHE